MTVHEAIRRRRSVRSYSTRPIPGEVLQKLRDALRLAPSACNIQPWRFVWVGDAGLRRELVQRARAPEWIVDAPWLVVGCGFEKRGFPAMGGVRSSIDVDVAIALDHLTLAAAAEGVGSCWVGSFDEAAARRVLGVPQEARIVAIMPLGYPAVAGALHPVSESARKSESEVFCTDGFAS